MVILFDFHNCSLYVQDAEGISDATYHTKMQLLKNERQQTAKVSNNTTEYFIP